MRSLAPPGSQNMLGPWSFDRDGYPYSSTGPDTVDHSDEFGTKTFLVKTVRQGKVGDMIFLRCFIRGRQVLCLVLPPKVAETIARQRHALRRRERVAAQTMGVIS